MTLKSLSSIYTTVYYVALNGHLFSEKQFLVCKLQSLAHITP